MYTMCTPVQVAKSLGVKANLKSTDIIAQLQLQLQLLNERLQSYNNTLVHELLSEPFVCFVGRALGAGVSRCALAFLDKGVVVVALQPLIEQLQLQLQLRLWVLKSAVVLSLSCRPIQRNAI